jgi:hypothetical protein
MVEEGEDYAINVLFIYNLDLSGFTVSVIRKKQKFSFLTIEFRFCETELFFREKRLGDDL